MKIFRILMFVLILCLTLTSCSKTNVNKSNANSTPVINKVTSTEASTKENVQDYNKLFELNLYSDKQTYKTTDKIKIWATLKYIGNDSQIKYGIAALI